MNKFSIQQTHKAQPQDTPSQSSFIRSHRSQLWDRRGQSPIKPMRRVRRQGPVCKCGHNFSQTPHKLVRWGVQARARAPPQGHEVTTQGGSRERGAAVVAAESHRAAAESHRAPCPSPGRCRRYVRTYSTRKSSYDVVQFLVSISAHNVLAHNAAGSTHSQRSPLPATSMYLTLLAHGISQSLTLTLTLQEHA